MEPERLRQLLSGPNADEAKKLVLEFYNLPADYSFEMVLSEEVLQ